MKQAIKRLLVLFLAFLIAICNSFTFVVYAEGDQSTSETDPSFVTEGTFQYTSNENFNKQITNDFTFREDCFMRSSFDGCCHLTVLSSQLAIASTSRYGDSEDQYEVQTENNSINARNMLEDMGFKDVSNNTYYDNMQLENSAGVAVGNRPIKVGGKEYTLLAIVPRSAGYKQEWAGNFTTEDGDIHYGFKAARDEALRYVKQYIDENGIEGDIKVWIVGHSRGAAMANMLAGFFAGGGIEYFDGKVSITPKDIYCYTYATPKTIKDGLDKNTELSVSGSRGTPYDNDTPGDAFTYTGGGTVDPSDSVYGGIRNYILSYDVITMLPPETWGYTNYGDITFIDETGCASIDDMLQELSDVSSYAYETYLSKGNPELFSWYTFDLSQMEMTESEAEHDYNNMTDFLKARMKGLTYNAGSTGEYVTDNYQDALKAIAGLYGMLLIYANDLEMDTLELPDGSIKALLFTILAYAAERLEVEGVTSDESEATTIALCDLLSYLTGDPISPEGKTADDFIKYIAKYFAENEDAPIVEKASTALANAINEALEDQGDFIKSLAYTLFAGFHPDYVEGDDPTSVPFDEAVKAFLIACYNGPAPGTQAYEYGNTDEDCRNIVFTLLYFVMPDASLSQTSSLQDVANVALGLLMTVTNEDETETTYANLKEAANQELLKVLASLLEEDIEDTASRFGDDYYNDVNGHYNALRTNIDEARRAASYLLLYNDGEEFSAGSAVENAVTFFKNVGIIPSAHYNEVYIAWMKALANSDCSNDCNHYIKLVEGKKETCEEDGLQEHWLYHDKSTDKYFDDKYLSNELSEDDLVLPKTGHDWGEWTVVKEPTTKKEGLKRRICKHDKTHVEEEPIDKLPEEPDKPVDPDEPVDPDNPDEPDKPVDPDEPDKPVDPDEPDKPVDPDEPDKPVDPDEPDKPVDPVKPDAPDKPQDEPTKPAKNKTTPKSGDSADIFTWGLLMTISLLGIIAGIKKRV